MINMAHVRNDLAYLHHEVEVVGRLDDVAQRDDPRVPQRFEHARLRPATGRQAARHKHTRSYWRADARARMGGGGARR